MGLDEGEVNFTYFLSWLYQPRLFWLQVEMVVQLNNSETVIIDL